MARYRTKVKSKGSKIENLAEKAGKTRIRRQNEVMNHKR